MPSIAIQALKPLTEPFMKTPWHGAQTILYCLLEDSLGTYIRVMRHFFLKVVLNHEWHSFTEKESGEYYDECKKANASARACNKENQERLWGLSLNMIPARFFN